VTLDPGRRLSAKQALEHEWLSAKPSLASYRQLREELIPPKLQEPLLLSPKDASIASRLAIDMAAKRRSFLTTHTVSWKGPNLPPTKTLSDLCTSKAPRKETSPTKDTMAVDCDSS
jgi:hypothetical protein